jgi:hypothetical protein
MALKSSASAVFARRYTSELSGQLWGGQSAEKLHPGTLGLKALTETKGFIAPLKTLRHPKSGFQQTVKARLILRYRIPQSGLHQR